MLAKCQGACADVHIVPYASDNYGYIIVDRNSKEAALVDAVDVGAFQKTLQPLGVNLKYILTTHHHLDHSGGNEQCQKTFPNVPIYGSAYETTPGATHPIKDAEELKLGKLTIKAVHVPTHTKGHIAYLVQGTEGDNLVFTGDFLFLAGCGRFFEGTATTMKSSVEKLIKTCNESTWMFPGHEYSMSNLKFAKHADPENVHIQEKMDQLSSRGTPTIPSQIGEEMKYNPFVRAVTTPTSFAIYKNDVETLLADLRKQKDSF